MNTLIKVRDWRPGEITEWVDANIKLGEKSRAFIDEVVAQLCQQMEGAIIAVNVDIGIRVQVAIENSTTPERRSPTIEELDARIKRLEDLELGLDTLTSAALE